MADYLSDALANIQQQSYAQNPFVQFGASLGNQGANAKAIYTNPDPWKQIALSGAMSLMGGLSTGYGQSQVNKDMAQVAPLVPQLYNDPYAVRNPGMKDSIFNSLITAAANEKQKRIADLMDLGLSETAKFGGNPLAQVQAKGYETENILKNMDLLERLQYVQQQQQGIQPAAPGQQVQQGAIPAMPTPESVVGAPVTPEEVLSPKRTYQDYLKEAQVGGMGFEAAKKYAEQSFATQTKEGLKAPRAEKPAEAKKDDFDTTDQAITVMANAVKSLPNYAGETGGFEKWKDTQLAAYLPKDSKIQQNAAKGLSAARMIEGVAPIVIAPLRKEVLSGATSNFDVEFLLKTVPDKFEITEANVGLMNNIKNARDLRKAERNFSVIMKQKGLSDKQITDQWNAARLAAGGSFLSSDGSLNPTLNRLIGGNL
jgi:hypothetical protein